MENFNSADSSAGSLYNDSERVRLFQGLLENEGHVYRNWGLSRSTQSAVYVEPISYADVQAVVWVKYAICALMAFGRNYRDAMDV
ncbi:MAG: hypothetical protein ABIT23_09160 [Nitrosospira sp.]